MGSRKNYSSKEENEFKLLKNVKSGTKLPKHQLSPDVPCPIAHTLVPAAETLALPFAADAEARARGASRTLLIRAKKQKKRRYKTRRRRKKKEAQKRRKEDQNRRKEDQGRRQEGPEKRLPVPLLNSKVLNYYEKGSPTFPWDPGTNTTTEKHDKLKLLKNVGPEPGRHQANLRRVSSLKKCIYCI